jgi:hypothetical protein
MIDDEPRDSSPPEEPDEPEDEALTPEQIEAEAALARLEDRIGAYTSYTLAADFLELREIFAGGFERMKEEDWARRIDRRPGGWTMRQTLAHVDMAAHLFNLSIVAGLEGRPVVIPGFERREDLKAFNAAAIEARAELSTAELTASFLGALEEAARLAGSLQAEHLGRLVTVPYYGSAPTVAELFGCSLAHAGIIHGAQLATARSRPIWIFFPPGMMRRQLTRYFHLLGLAYWPERGGDLHATFGFHAEGQGGGSWTVRAHPRGGHGKIGIPRTADVSFHFASTDLLCRFITFQARTWRYLLLRRLRVSGNLNLARRMAELFSAT